MSKVSPAFRVHGESFRSQAVEHNSGLAWRVERRIPSLDALRGIAAFAVVVHHSIFQHIGIAEQSPSHTMAHWLGSWGVTLFFVLSGFCIHLPQARRLAVGDASVDWRGFSKRRAWRLLPTHYASLVLAAGVAYFSPTYLLSRPTPASFTAHVFMVHTLSATTFASINAVFWSIAIEVHFYLAYPVFLWFRRIFGNYLVPFLAIVGLVTYFLASLSSNTNIRAVGQRIFLVSWWQWALGAMFAEIYLRGTATRLIRIVHFPGAAWVWGLVSLAIGLGDLTVFHLHVRYWILPVTCSLLLGAVLVRPPRWRGMQIWQRIGAFSYSLYLVHPVALALLVLLPMGSISFFIQLVIDSISALLLSWLFFLVIERHFLNSPPQPDGTR